MILKKRVIVSLAILFIACIFLINGVSALDATLNASITEVNAAICINDSKVIMQAMIDDGFNVLSINDALKQAELTYTAQTLLKEKKDKYDFSAVFQYCDAIKKIREDALNAKDEVNSLMMFYNDSVVPGMNTTSIDVIISEINTAITEERYTEVDPLVQKAYTEITTVKSSYTSLNVFYKSTARGFMAFLSAKNPILQITNWQFLLGLVVLILILLLIYRVQIRKMRLNKKLSKLVNRKKTIKELVIKTQKDYFQYGKIPEGEYNIKTKRFAELVRDIDRQIPLLQEEIARMGGSKNLFKTDSELISDDYKEVSKEKIENVKIKPKVIAAKKHEKSKTRVKSHKKIVRGKKKR